MYHKYFGLEEAPFSIAVNPRYLFMSERHRDALAHLLYGVGVGGGFILLTGEVGTGKTTIIRCLLEQLPPKTDVALILNPALDAVQLLAVVCDELHIDYQDQDRNLKELTDKLHRFLLENHQRGRNTVLLIDEAQHLQFEALEQIRLLTNLETNTRKLLQIILIGQPELKVMLARPELRQLSQRVTARYQLKPLTLDETAGYIRHRLQVAGLHANQELFPPKVVQHIHKESQGIPRLINVLCDRILLGTYGQNKARVDMAMARQATLEVKGEDDERIAGSARWAWPAAAAVLLLTAAGALLWWQGQQADIASLAGDADPLPGEVAAGPGVVPASPVPASDPAPATPDPQPDIVAGIPARSADTAAAPAPVAPDAGPDQDPDLTAVPALSTMPETAPVLPAETGDQGPSSGAAADVTALLAEPVPWLEQPAFADTPVVGDAIGDAIDQAGAEHETHAIAGEQPALDAMVFYDRSAALALLLVQQGIIDAPLKDPCRRLASERWRCDTLRAESWPQLLTYNAPVVIEILTPDGVNAWLVVVSLEDDSVMLAGEQGDYSITLEQLGELWTGTFVLPWQKPPGYTGPMRLDDEGEAVTWLAQQFAQLDGQPKGLADTRYNELLQQRVALFQSEQLLLVDGVAGTNTILRVRQLLGESPVLQVETTAHTGAQ